MERHKIDDVYGLARRRVPLTYLSRTDVDTRFLNELGRDNHIVIYGSSKQGKTSLLIETLQENDFLVAQCSTDWDKSKLYSTILRNAGVTIIDTTSRRRGRTDELTADVETEIGSGIFAKFKARISGKAGTSSDTTTEERTIPVDLSSASDVVDLLNQIEFSRFIVIEDFHYLPLDVQKDFAADLKVFYERSAFSFIIVGVWLEANRLIVYNGDLAHRITSIPADTWTDDELRQVIRSGEPLMNAEFSDAVVAALADRAQKNVGQLQEALRQMFLQRGIYVTADDKVVFDSVEEVEQAYSYVAEQLAGRYANSISKFSEGLRDRQLHMYKWIMHAVISATPEDRRAGLKTMEIVRHIQANHPKGKILPNNVDAALKNVAQVQSHAGITPIILDYDLTHARLTIVDNGFHVYLEGTPTEDALSYLASFPNETAEGDDGEGVS